MANNVLALIPARAGSKRVPMKNFKELNGLSLVERAAQQALAVQGIDQVVISTDRKDLVEKSVKPHDKIQIHQRSAQASSDEATAQSVIEEVLREYKAETLIYLQPTSPLRDVEDIQQALTLFNSRNFDNVVSVMTADPSLYYSMQISDDKQAKFLFPDALKARSQDLQPIYTLNGAIYISSGTYILKHKSFFSGKVGVYKMSAEKSIDIDTQEDWKRAEEQLKAGVK